MKKIIYITVIIIIAILCIVLLSIYYIKDSQYIAEKNIKEELEKRVYNEVTIEKTINMGNEKYIAFTYYDKEYETPHVGYALYEKKSIFNKFESIKANYTTAVCSRDYVKLETSEYPDIFVVHGKNVDKKISYFKIIINGKEIEENISNEDVFLKIYRYNFNTDKEIDFSPAILFDKYGNEMRVTNIKDF